MFKKGTKKPNTIIRWLAYLLALLIVSVLLIGAVVGWYIQRQGGLAAILEEQLSRPEDGLFVDIGKISWSLRWRTTPLVLDVMDVEITLGTQQFDLPHSILFFGAQSLINEGHPEVLIVDGLQVNLTHSGDEWRFQNAVIGDDAALDFEIVTQRLRTLLPALGLRRMLLQIDTITLEEEGTLEEAQLDGSQPNEDRAIAEPLKFTDVTVVFDLVDLTQMAVKFRAIQVQVEQEQINADEARIYANLQGDLFSDFWQLVISGDQFRLAPIQQYFPNDYLKFTDNSTVSGKFFTQFDAGVMLLANLDISLSGADIHLGAPTNLQGSFETIDLAGAYSLEDNRITISKAELQMVDKRRLSIDGQLSNIHDGSVGLSGTLRTHDIALHSILGSWSDKILPQQQLDARARLDDLLSGGHFSSLDLAFSGEYDLKGEALSISKLAGRGNFSGVRLNAKFEQYRSVVGTVGGRVDVALAEGGALESAYLDVMMENGFLVLDGINTPVQLPKAGISAHYQAGVLFIENLFADFDNLGSLTADATITIDTSNSAPLGIVASLSSDVMDLHLFQTLWPNQMAKSTIDLVRAQIAGGQLQDVNLHVTATKERAQTAEVTNITGHAKLMGTSYKWAKTSPVIAGIDADLEILNNQLDILITSGHIGDLSLDTGAVSIQPLVAPKGVSQNISVSFSGAGKAQDAAEVLSHPTVDLIPPAMWALELGDAEAKASVKFVYVLEGGTLEGGQHAVTDLHIESLITSDQISGLPYEARLQNTKIALSVENDKVQVQGGGTYLGVPLQFQLNTDDSKDVAMTIMVAENTEFNKHFSAATGLEMMGASSAKVQVNYQPQSETVQLVIDADMTKTGLHLPIVNFAKLQGEAGQVSIGIRLKRSVIEAIDIVNLELGSLTAKGRLVFNNENQLQAGQFETIALPGYDIKDVILERAKSGEIKLSANVTRGDLAPLLQDSDTDGLFAPIQFDITAGRLQVSKKITLSGHLIGHMARDMTGAATLLGDIIVDGKPLIEEVTIDADLQPTGLVLKGNGQISGVETSLNFSWFDDDKPVLILESEKGGRVLRGLGVTDAIRGGQLRIVNSYIDADLSDFDTVIDLDNFDVIEAPSIIRALSVLSFAGLYSLVEGDGTRFVHGDAHISVRGGVYQIEELKAGGRALGVHMVGNFDTNTKIVDISGNLVPFNTVSKILSDVWLLGPLLTGWDESGLFTTQFSVTGPSDDLEVQTNKSSVLPGVLRDLFSPDWLDSEDKRIRAEEAPK